MQHDYYITSHGKYCKCHKFPGGASCHCYGGGYHPWYYHPFYFHPGYGWPHPHFPAYGWPHHKPPFKPPFKPQFMPPFKPPYPRWQMY